jgi:hypothetical protein
MKRNVKTSVLLFLSFLVVTGATSQKAVFTADKYTGLEPGDGTSYLNAMHFDEKSKFLYNISNDDHKVYIDIIVSDRAAVQKTMMYGLTTWIDPLGKKKKTLGIVFPVPGDSRDLGIAGPRGKDMKGMRDAAMKQRNGRMLLKGFSGKGSQLEINPQEDPNFSGRIESMEDGKVRVFIGISLDQVGQPGVSPFSLGFETGYMDLNETGMVAGGSPQGGGDYHRDGPPGGGPPSGGGMDRTGTQTQQSGNQQAQPDLNELAKPSRIWIKQVILTL